MTNKAKMKSTAASAGYKPGSSRRLSQQERMDRAARTLNPTEDEKALRRMIWYYTRLKDWPMVQRITQDLGRFYERQEATKKMSASTDSEAVVGT